MQTRLKFTSDGVLYEGFTSWHESTKMDPRDRIVVVWFDGDPDSWLVDCDGGIGELRRYYREQYERTDLTITVFTQDLPIHVVSMDFEDGSVVKGPFYSEAAANAYAAEHRQEYDYVDVSELDKP